MAKDTNLISLTTQRSIPLESAGTGTITSVNNEQKIVGVGTLFTEEVNIGDFIYIKSQNALRRVENIVNDLELTIDEPFAVALAADAFDVTPRPRYVEVSLDILPGAGALVDGVLVAAGKSVTFSKAGQSSSYGKRRLDPIDVDASGSPVTVLTIA
jgi:hypothetical protein